MACCVVPVLSSMWPLWVPQGAYHFRVSRGPQPELEGWLVHIFAVLVFICIGLGAESWDSWARPTTQGKTHSDLNWNLMLASGRISDTWHFPDPISTFTPGQTPPPELRRLPLCSHTHTHLFPPSPFLEPQHWRRLLQVARRLGMDGVGLV